MSNGRDRPLTRSVERRTLQLPIERCTEVNRSRLVVGSKWKLGTGERTCSCGAALIHETESRGKKARKIDGSTCIRDTAPCRTDEPLWYRLTFFHAAAAPRVAPLITNTVPLFLSFASCTSLRIRSPSRSLYSSITFARVHSLLSLSLPLASALSPR